MELRDYLRTLSKRWKFIALVTLVGIALAAAGTAMMTPTYTATTQLFVSVQSEGSTATELQ